jgi:hypothetical protein
MFGICRRVGNANDPRDDRDQWDTREAGTKGATGTHGTPVRKRPQGNEERRRGAKSRQTAEWSRRARGQGGALSASSSGVRGDRRVAGSRTNVGMSGVPGIAGGFGRRCTEWFCGKYCLDAGIVGRVGGGLGMGILARPSSRTGYGGEPILRAIRGPRWRGPRHAVGARAVSQAATTCATSP